MGKKLTGLTAIAASMLMVPTANAITFTEAFTEGKAHLNFRLRFEDVTIEPAAGGDDITGNATTLQTRLNFETADFYGFKYFIEMDDVTAVTDDRSYNSTINNTPNRAVIADPEYTEINQSWLSYTAFKTTAKWGKQRILLDNQRFVGGVGWRQNEQTYDGFSVSSTIIPRTKLFLASVHNVNRIFSENSAQGDHKHGTILANANVNIIDDYLSVTPYVYLIENRTAWATSNDTKGLRVTGQHKGDVNFQYTVEFAKQSEMDDDKQAEYDASYSNIEFGVGYMHWVNVKLGRESLGSDDGVKAFQTPLATLHAFQGWNDQFLTTPNEGIIDSSLTVSGKIPVANVNWAVVSHGYTSDEDNASGDDDLGSEVDVVVAYKFLKNYSVAAKYAAYSAGDDTFNRNDTDKFWLTLTANF